MAENLTKINYHLEKDEQFGFQYLSPLPSEKELADFYRQDYYQCLQQKQKTSNKGGRDAKLISSDQAVREKELNWLQKTYFLDRLEMFNNLIGKAEEKSLLDIGCGTGEFLEYMQKAGWQVSGLEPSEEAWQKAKEKGLFVDDLGLSQFCEQRKTDSKKFDAISLVNVLEHVLNPKQTLSQVKELLRTSGILFIQVPNSFNQLQLAANQKVKKKQWWVVAPDHISYFNFSSLEKLLKANGFEVLLKTTDFPMEIFLLMNENYVDQPAQGKQCHQKRVNFELSIDKQTRRDIYNQLAQINLGRSCLIYAKAI